ncbi:MAG: fibronectin type III domain-containing protein [Myxococcaceae bacterium]|nr:fibronectin type III domain-containing protein [Myxococcaceae bacterium]
MNLDKVAIPQADEQQRLLANLILHMARDRKPLPRFWYFPREAKAVVVMTGDDHANGGTAGRWLKYRSDSPAGCSVQHWECVRGTSYVFPGVPLTDVQAAEFEAEGFELALHVNTGCANFTPESLDSNFRTQLAEFASRFPSLPPPTTNRTHCIAWSDWASMAKVERRYGIRLDVNYYYFPPAWLQDRPGVFTGSGLPMRFADVDGTLIDVYQATTQMTDESGQSYPSTIDALLDAALGPEGFYGAFVANMHTDAPYHERSDAIVTSAKSRGVPVVTSLQLLEWLDGRNASSFQDVSWDGTALRLRVVAGEGARGLVGMLPAVTSAGVLTSVEREGTPVTYTVEQLKGVWYAVFSALPGTYVVHYDSSPLELSTPMVTAGERMAQVRWTSNRLSDSQVVYGTSPQTLTLSVSNAAPTTAHGLTLEALTPGTTYFYRVLSKDVAGTRAVSPAAPSPPWSFTVPGPGTAPGSALGTPPGPSGALVEVRASGCTTGPGGPGALGLLGLAALVRLLGRRPRG